MSRISPDMVERYVERALAARVEQGFERGVSDLELLDLTSRLLDPAQQPYRGGEHDG